MRFASVALLIGLCAIAAATSTYGEQGYHPHKYGGQDYQAYYKKILSLFKNVHQQSYYKQHVDIAKDYSIENNIDKYSNPQVVKDFLQLYHDYGVLPKDEIFSVFYKQHLKQAVALFKLFYSAKDHHTFYNTAVWARYHMNQGMFLYCYYVALVHRPDTCYMELPPIYEIYPYYFFDAKVIRKAQQYKQMYSDSGVQQHDYTIYANYSGYYANVHPEQSMSYYTEDVGINSYYYFYNLYRPFWMSSQEYGLNTYHRGEEFYYFYQQFLARYYLERLSNGKGDIKTYQYEDEFETGYYPNMAYHNGMQFSHRPNWAKFFTNFYNYQQSKRGGYPYSYTYVKDYERRIRDAIDSGYVYTENGTQIKLYEAEGFNILGNLIESNPYSVNARFYGYLQIFARHLLGYSYQPLDKYKIAPSALEHFETSLRDPAFWQLYKRIVMYFQKYKCQLARYTYEEMFYPGVKVESVTTDRLVTYFEQYNVDINNAVYLQHNEWDTKNNFEVYARQYRLNHKPFSYKINAYSEKPSQAVVRVFIGPKYDEYGRVRNINENRINFVEFDKFKYELRAGQNVIERNSREVYCKDRTTYKQLYQYAANAGEEEYSASNAKCYPYSFPNRFLLPKGKYGGQTYQFYVIITPYTANSYAKHHAYGATHDEKHNYYKYPTVGLGVPYFDAYPLGYPFDRPIDEAYFYVPNGYFQDVTIYHQHGDKAHNTASGFVNPEYKAYGSQYYQNYSPYHYDSNKPKYYQDYQEYHHGSQ